jgi:hypothetical protein
MSPQTWQSQELKKKIIICYKADSQTPKNALYVTLWLLKFQDEL